MRPLLMPAFDTAIQMKGGSRCGLKEGRGGGGHSLPAGLSNEIKIKTHTCHTIRMDDNCYTFRRIFHIELYIQ